MHFQIKLVIISSHIYFIKDEISEIKIFRPQIYTFLKNYMYVTEKIYFWGVLKTSAMETEYLASSTNTVCDQGLSSSTD